MNQRALLNQDVCGDFVSKSFYSKSLNSNKHTKIQRKCRLLIKADLIFSFRDQFSEHSIINLSGGTTFLVVMTLAMTNLRKNAMNYL